MTIITQTDQPIDLRSKNYVVGVAAGLLVGALGMHLYMGKKRNNPNLKSAIAGARRDWAKPPASILREAKMRSLEGEPVTVYRSTSSAWKISPISHTIATVSGSPIIRVAKGKVQEKRSNPSRRRYRARKN